MNTEIAPWKLLRFTNAAKHSEADVVAKIREICFPDQLADADAPLVDIDDDDPGEAWGAARLGLIVRGHISDDLRRARALLHDQPVYDVVHMFQPMAPLDIYMADDWDPAHAYDNGYSLYVFRKGDQRHVRRGSQVRHRSSTKEIADT